MPERICNYARVVPDAPDGAETGNVLNIDITERWGHPILAGQEILEGPQPEPLGDV